MRENFPHVYFNKKNNFKYQTHKYSDLYYGVRIESYAPVAGTVYL